MELPFNFAMDIAWNASRFSFEMIPTYLQLYAERGFGPEHAEKIAGLLLEFSHMIGMRRFEMVHPATYSILNYHEAERVLARWTSLADQTMALYAIMSEEVKPAFYQLLFYPIVSGANYYAITIGIGRNHQSAMVRYSVQISRYSAKSV